MMNLKAIQRKLEDIDQEIKRRETEKIRAETQLDAVKDALKTEFGCKSFKEASQKQESLQAEIKDLEKTIEQKLDALETELEQGERDVD